jgi:hypothetical protein
MAVAGRKRGHIWCACGSSFGSCHMRVGGARHYPGVGLRRRRSKPKATGLGWPRVPSVPSVVNVVLYGGPRRKMFVVDGLVVAIKPARWTSIAAGGNHYSMCHLNLERIDPNNL